MLIFRKKKLFPILNLILFPQFIIGCLIISILFLGLFPKKVQCATYYVSSSTGKDTNLGLTPQSPWKTLSRIEKADFRGGDSILLKRGDIWLESLSFLSSGTEERPILISAYGEGAMPVVNGAMLVSNWFPKSGDIYFSPYWGTCRGLFEDGIPLKLATSPSLKDGQWFFDEKLLYYKPTKGNIREHRIERCAKSALLTIREKQYLIIDGIFFYGASYFGIRLIDCSNIIIRNCRVSNNGQEGISIQRMRADLRCRSIKIIENNVEWNANGVYITGKGGGFKSSGYLESEIKNNNIIYTNHKNIWGHNTKDGHAIGIQNSSFCRIEGNKITDNYSGIALWTSELHESRNNVFSRNYIARNHLYGIAHGADGYNNSFKNVISFNIIVDNGHWPGNWGGLRINKRQESGNHYYNNTLSNNDINIFFYSFPDFHIVKNNISLNPAKYHIWLDDSAGQNNVIENNCYHPEGQASFYSKATKDVTFVEWKQHSGHDTKSFEANPLFKSAKPNIPEDFCLTANSPCIGRAAEEGLELKKDYLGNSIKDLGACGLPNKY